MYYIYVSLTSYAMYKWSCESELLESKLASWDGGWLGGWDGKHTVHHWGLQASLPAFPLCSCFSTSHTDWGEISVLLGVTWLSAGREKAPGWMRWRRTAPTSGPWLTRGCWPGCLTTLISTFRRCPGTAGTFRMKFSLAFTLETSELVSPHSQH